MRVFTCSLCQNIYLTERIFHQHVRTHSEDHDIKCTDCGKAFMLRGDLTRHVRRHRGELPYECPHCQKRFLRKYHMDRHVDKRHTNTVRPEDLCRNKCGRGHSRHVYPFCTPCAGALGVKRGREIREVASVQACRCFDYLNRKLGLGIVHVHFDPRDRSLVSGHERDDYIPGLKVRADGYEKDCPNHVWEFLGRRWHGHPGSDAHTETMARLRLFADHGYVVHYVWSDEWTAAKTLKDRLRAVHLLSHHPTELQLSRKSSSRSPSNHSGSVQQDWR